MRDGSCAEIFKATARIKVPISSASACRRSATSTVCSLQNSPQMDVYRERVSSGQLATVRGIKLNRDDEIAPV